MSGANVSPTGRNKEEWFVQATDSSVVDRTTPSALSKERGHLFDARPPLIVLNVKVLIIKLHSGRRAGGKCGKAERFGEAFPSSCGNPHQEKAAEGHRFVRGFP